MSNKIKVYLGGYTQLIDYRKSIHEQYDDDQDIEIIDPMIHEEDKSSEKIVEDDIEMICNCDILVAKIENITFGTTMEIRAAFSMNIPVFVISSNEEYLNDIWLNYHTMKFFNTNEGCFEFIKNHKEDLQNRLDYNMNLFNLIDEIKYSDENYKSLNVYMDQYSEVVIEKEENDIFQIPVKFENPLSLGSVLDFTNEVKRKKRVNTPLYKGLEKKKK